MSTNDDDLDNIEKEILSWIDKNDCRSAMIAYRYAEVKYKNWLPVLKNRRRYSFLKLYIKSRNYEQRDKKISAPEGMSLYSKGGMINPFSLKIDMNK